MDLETSSFYVCVYEYYKVVQCNLLHFIKLYYVDVLAKVSSNQWFYSEYVLPVENITSLRFIMKQVNVTNTKKTPIF